MIKIDFSEPDTLEWKKWREKCELEKKSLIEAVESGRTPKIKVLYKKQKDFYRDVNGPFHGKCAYCEQRISSGQHGGEIEHFRPKKRVVDKNNGKPVQVNIDGNLTDHPGYYWLAYDCFNLLLSCIDCNQNWKKSFFPVEDFQACKRGDEKKEKPLLIHPCIDNPEDHIEMDEFGLFHEKTNKGKMSEDILGLNLRGLPDERKRIYNNVRNQMGFICSYGRLIENPKLVKNKIKEIRGYIDGTEEYCIAGIKAIRDAKKYTCNMI